MKSIHRYSIMIWAFALVVWVNEGQGQSGYTTPKLSLHLDARNQLVALEQHLMKERWNAQKGNLYLLEKSGSTTAKLNIVPSDNGNLILSLSITNTDRDSVIVAPTFPYIRNLKPSGGSPDELYYLFPSQGKLADNRQPVQLREVYSGNFPLQFMDIYKQHQGGFYILCKDTTNYSKAFSLSKQNGAITLGVQYRERKLAPGETWTLPTTEIGAHTGDWHEAFFAYRNWVREWYQPLTERKQWFRDIYNFRQLFLHTIFGEEGAFDSKTKKIDLLGKVAADKIAFGGVDFVHIFDWGKTPDAGRVGDYSPWNYLGGKENLKKEIEKLKKQGIKVGLYQEGYLINTVSKIGQQKGKEWQQLDMRGLPYLRMGDEYYYPCPLVKEWRDYITDIAKNVSDDLITWGSYIDQFGFGWQYGCYNPTHGHDISITSFPNGNQLRAEDQLMKELKAKLGKERVTYTEEMPTDVSTQFQDGSFSYAVTVAADPSKKNPSRANLARFALPDYKLFEILHVDEPVGHDTLGIKGVFFNGEGLWIEGPAADTAWFPENTKRVIRKTYSILSEYSDAFGSDNPIPLVETLNENVHANYFPSRKRNLWTLFNTSDTRVSGNILKTPHIKGAVYFDAWNRRQLVPELVDGYDIIKLTIEAQDLGCIVQILKP